MSKKTSRAAEYIRYHTLSRAEPVRSTGRVAGPSPALRPLRIPAGAGFPVSRPIRPTAHSSYITGRMNISKSRYVPSTMAGMYTQSSMEINGIESGSLGSSRPISPST